VLGTLSDAAMRQIEDCLKQFWDSVTEGGDRATDETSKIITGWIDRGVQRGVREARRENVLDVVRDFLANPDPRRSAGYRRDERPDRLSRLLLTAARAGSWRSSWRPATEVRAERRG